MEERIQIEQGSKQKNVKERINLWHDHFKELIGNETYSSIHIAPDENEQESSIIDPLLRKKPKWIPN